MVAYKAKFHVLSRLATQLVTIEEERNHLFIRGLSFILQVLYVHMNYSGRSFNEITNNVKKVEGMRQYNQAKALAKRSNTRVTQKVLIREF